MFELLSPGWLAFDQSKGNSSKLDKVNQIWGTCTSKLYRMVNLNFPYNCPIRVQIRVLTLVGLSGLMVGRYNASFKTFQGSSKLFVIHIAISHRRHPWEAKLSIIGVNQLKITCGCSFYLLFSLVHEKDRIKTDDKFMYQPWQTNFSNQSWVKRLGCFRSKWKYQQIKN